MFCTIEPFSRNKFFYDQYGRLRQKTYNIIFTKTPSLRGVKIISSCFTFIMCWGFQPSGLHVIIYHTNNKHDGEPLWLKIMIANLTTVRRVKILNCFIWFVWIKLLSNYNATGEMFNFQCNELGLSIDYILCSVYKTRQMTLLNVMRCWRGGGCCWPDEWGWELINMLMLVIKSFGLPRAQCPISRSFPASYLHDPATTVWLRTKNHGLRYEYNQEA